MKLVPSNVRTTMSKYFWKSEYSIETLESVVKYELETSPYYKGNEKALDKESIEVRLLHCHFFF